MAKMVPKILKPAGTLNRHLRVGILLTLKVVLSPIYLGLKSLLPFCHYYSALSNEMEFGAFAPISNSSLRPGRKLVPNWKMG